MGLRPKCKIYNLRSEKNVSVNTHDLGLGNGFLRRDTKTQATTTT